MPSMPALFHAVFVIAGWLTYFLVTRIREQRRHPSAAVAWVLGIAALPYLGVPLFLLFGTRKFARPSPLRPAPRAALGDAEAAEWATRLLAGLGVAAPTRNPVVSFHADGPAALRALIGLLDGAERELAVGTYVLGDDEVGAAAVERLRAAAARGVRCRLLVDSIGSLRVSRRLLAHAQQGGVEVRRFMPLLHNPLRGRTNLRNHRKLAIADGRRVWAGGRNLAGEYFVGRSGADPWRDLSFVVEGPLAAEALVQFDHDWAAASGQARGGANGAPAASGSAGGGVPALAPSGSLTQWVACGPDRAEDTVYALLMAAAYHARERILAVTPYFVPDDALLDAWCIACRRGVRVQLVLPARSNHRLADLARGRALRRLADAGAEVRFSPAMLHAKAVVVDDRLALCGSVNLDGRSLFLNFEVMTAFYGAAEIAWLADWIEAQGHESRAYRSQRPPWQRDLIESIVRAVGFQL